VAVTVAADRAAAPPLAARAMTGGCVSTTSWLCSAVNPMHELTWSRPFSTPISSVDSRQLHWQGFDYASLCQKSWTAVSRYSQHT